MQEKRRRWIALDKRVIVVAIEGGAKDWAAYIGAVPGQIHYLEWQEVAEHGSKIPKEMAQLLFPDFKDLTWRE